MITRLLFSTRSPILLAAAVMIASFGLPASLQAQAFSCVNGTGVPPLVRAEGFAELLGDVVLDCTGGIPTPPNQKVPQVDITVNLDVNVTSKVTAVSNQVEFLETLLIVDEPNAPPNPTRAILNCGRPEAPDNTPGGLGVCSILGGGSLGAANTYEGTPNHPNVFQGRSFRRITGQANQVVFSGIPIDPPGTVCPVQVNGQCHRIIRITNLRGDATAKGVVAANVTQTVTADLVINPVANLPVDDPSHAVARVQLGLIGPNVGAGSILVQEGFSNSWKPRNTSLICANGAAKPTYVYTGGTSNPPDAAQTVPGAVYDTESGFQYQNDSINKPLDEPTNALTCSAVSSLGNAFASAGFGGVNTGITGAGVADAGTRFVVRFPDIPPGASVQVPPVVKVYNVITRTITGVMVLTNTDSSGAGPFSPASGILTAANNTAAYEILFANPSALENAEIPLTLLNAPPNTTLHVTAGYAPLFVPTDEVRRTSATLPVPRFLDSGAALCLVGTCARISPNQGPNSGPISVAIYGDPVLSNAQVKLSRAGFPDILGTGTANSNPTFLSTTFDLTGASTGARDIVVTPQTGPSVTFPGLFLIAPPAPCFYEIPSSSPITFPAGGGSGDLVVTPKPSTCVWDAGTTAPWITLLPKSNSVTQPYTVDANPTGNPRNGQIRVEGVYVWVVQEGACTYDVSPGDKVFDFGGGSASVNVTAPVGCPWSASYDSLPLSFPPGWAHISAGSSGSGNGTVTLQIDPNLGAPRSATLSIYSYAGLLKKLSVRQGAPSPCGASDVSTQVSVVRGVFLSNFLGTAYTQQLKLTNSGPAIPGPIYLVVDGLVAGSVAPTARTTTCQSTGTSYMVLAAAGGLSAGQAANLTLTFQPGLAAKGAPPSWTTLRVFSGTPSQ